MLLGIKTTVDIPDSLLHAARERARSEGTTLRELVAEGLRSVLDRRADDRPDVPPEPVFEGATGLRDGVDLHDWDALRETAYGRWA